MGWWSPSIMGGDTPLDIQSVFEERFGASEPDPDEDTPAFRIPTAGESLQFMHDINARGWGDDDIVAEVTAFLVMDRGAPMHDELRAAAIAACRDEDTSHWNNPAERDTELAEFSKLVAAYPSEGAGVELPHQPGLFEVAAAHLSKK